MTEDVASDSTDELKPLSVEIVQISDVGLVRTENQDFAIISTPNRLTSTEGKGALMVVADGMGGHRGGATASKLAAQTIGQVYESAVDSDPSAALRDALEQANAVIYKQAQENPELRGMGTTCSALVVRGRVAYIAHVGDSRIYLERNGQIRQLTEDHSLVATMVKEGLLTSQEAEVHPRRNVLQRSMGVAQQVEVDTPDALLVQPGDTFVLCSDGLHGLVRELEIAEIATLPIDEAVRELVDLALERGAPDNVTVVVARVVDPDAPPQERVRRKSFDQDEPTAKMPAAHEMEPEAPRSGVLKWLLLLAMLLVAAGGALLYWEHENDMAMAPAAPGWGSP